MSASLAVVATFVYVSDDEDKARTIASLQTYDFLLKVSDVAVCHWVVAGYCEDKMFWTEIARAVQDVVAKKRQQINKFLSAMLWKYKRNVGKATMSNRVKRAFQDSQAVEYFLFADGDILFGYVNNNNNNKRKKEESKHKCFCIDECVRLMNAPTADMSRITVVAPNQSQDCRHHVSMFSNFRKIEKEDCTIAWTLRSDPYRAAMAGGVLFMRNNQYFRETSFQTNFENPSFAPEDICFINDIIADHAGTAVLLVDRYVVHPYEKNTHKAEKKKKMLLESLTKMNAI